MCYSGECPYEVYMGDCILHFDGEKPWFFNYKGERVYASMKGALCVAVDQMIEEDERKHPIRTHYRKICLKISARQWAYRAMKNKYGDDMPF